MSKHGECCQHEKLKFCKACNLVYCELCDWEFTPKSRVFYTKDHYFNTIALNSCCTDGTAEGLVTYSCKHRDV